MTLNALCYHPQTLFLDSEEMLSQLERHPRIAFAHFQREDGSNLEVRKLPPLGIQAKATDPAGHIKSFLNNSSRVLFLSGKRGSS